MNLAHWNVGTRLSAAFATVLVLMALLAALNARGLGRIIQEVDELVHQHQAKVAAIHQVTETTRENAALTMLLFLQPDEAQRQSTAARIDANRELITAQLELLGRLIARPQGKALLAEVQRRRADYVRDFVETRRLLGEGEMTLANEQLVKHTLPSLEDLQAKLGELQAFQTGLAREAGAASVEQIAHDERMTLGLLAAALALGVAAAWWITRTITRPLRDAMDATERIAQGDLGVAIEARSRDELGRLLGSLQNMRNSLRSLVGDVRASVESVSTASSQIAAGNQDLSSRTEEQASSLQQSAASVEQLAGTVKQSAASAVEARELAGSAAASAHAGGEVMQQVVQTMGEISAASARIGEIINVIDGIAFQTNILALNAAVEAARAGEQGRGFAVVAGEVRQLAQRSAGAAREIKSMIGASSEKVESGAQLVQRAGRSIEDIVRQVQHMATLVGEISSAAQQQSQGLDQVNQAMSTMDEVTQRNAALVEESAAAAESLAAQAQQLSETIGVFRLSSAVTDARQSALG
jgi:methyl-accepting chemotaxis protein